MARGSKGVDMEWLEAVKCRQGCLGEADWNSTLSPSLSMLRRSHRSANETVDELYAYDDDNDNDEKMWTLRGHPLYQESTDGTESPLFADSQSNSDASSTDEFMNFPSYEHEQESDAGYVSDLELDRLIGDAVKALDDTKVQCNPTHHVDYLTHDWRNEDIWASWKHVVSRREDYNNSSRLENACWRSWAKSMANLPTISPEAINWTKDCDVTWLYGPLQAGKSDPLGTSATSTLKVNSSVHSSANTSDAARPILKKQKLSEMLLQTSASSTSTSRRSSPKLNPPSPDQSISRAKTLPIHLTSVSTPTPEKTVRFQDEVRQCIVVETIQEEEPLDDEAAASVSGSKASFEVLPSTNLKDDDAKTNVTAERISSWNPSRISSYLSNTTPSSTPTTEVAQNSANNLKLFSPKPTNAANNGCGFIVTFSEDHSFTEAMTDEEYFEMEMFGEIQQKSRPSQAINKAIGDLEEMHSSSPSISDYLSSGSDDLDDDYTQSMIWNRRALPPQQPSNLKSTSDFVPSWQQLDDGDEEENWWNGV